MVLLQGSLSTCFELVDELIRQQILLQAQQVSVTLINSNCVVQIAAQEAGLAWCVFIPEVQLTSEPLVS